MSSTAGAQSPPSPLASPPPSPEPEENGCFGFGFGFGPAPGDFPDFTSRPVAAATTATTGAGGAGRRNGGRRGAFGSRGGAREAFRIVGRGGTRRKAAPSPASGAGAPPPAAAPPPPPPASPPPNHGAAAAVASPSSAAENRASNGNVVVPNRQQAEEGDDDVKRRQQARHHQHHHQQTRRRQQLHHQQNPRNGSGADAAGEDATMMGSPARPPPSYSRSQSMMSLPLPPKPVRQQRRLSSGLGSTSGVEWPMEFLGDGGPPDDAAVADDAREGAGVGDFMPIASVSSSSLGGGGSGGGGGGRCRSAELFPPVDDDDDDEHQREPHHPPPPPRPRRRVFARRNSVQGCSPTSSSAPSASAFMDGGSEHSSRIAASTSSFRSSLSSRSSSALLFRHNTVHGTSSTAASASAASALAAVGRSSSVGCPGGFGGSFSSGPSCSLESLFEQQPADDYVDDIQHLRERKKIRARRNSIQGTVEPLCSSSGSYGDVAAASGGVSSFSHLAARSRAATAEDWRRTMMMDGDGANAGNSSAPPSGEGSPPGRKSSSGGTLGACGGGSVSLFEPSSPSSRSVASSSTRKRGVGGSPLGSDSDNLDGCGSSSNSFGMMSLSQHGTPGAMSSPPLGHSRSRSRIFSPPPAASSSVAQAAAAPHLRPPFSCFGFGGGSRNGAAAIRAPSPADERGVMDIDSSSSDEDDSDDDDDRNGASRDVVDRDDTSLESLSGRCCGDDPMGEVVVMLSAPPDRRSADSEEDVLDTMPSYQDLAYLIHVLRREQRSGCALFGFGSASWTVAPKNTWDARRRSAFMQWCTTNLNFSIRSAGAGAAYLQLPGAAGKKVLGLCESARLLHNRRREEQLLKCADTETETADSTTATGSSAATAGAAAAAVVRASQEEPSFRIVDTSMLSARKASPAVATSSLSRMSSIGNPIDTLLGRRFNDESTEDLTSRMLSLDVNDGAPPTAAAPAPARTSVESAASSDSLVRQAAADPNRPSSIGSYACPPRPSLDNDVVGSQDMMSHLYPEGGNSGGRRQQLQPPVRMSLASIPDEEGGMKEAAFCPSRLSLQSNNSDAAGRPSIPYAPLAAVPSFEIMETPMPQQDENWGSRAVGGRDWGTSTRCPSVSQKALTKLMEKLTKEAGVRDSFEGPLLPLDGPGRSILHFEPDSDPDAEMTVIPETGRNRTVRIEDGGPVLGEREVRRRRQNFKKHKRMSIFMATSQPSEVVGVPGRQSLFLPRSRLTTFESSAKRASLIDMDFQRLDICKQAEEPGSAPDIFAVDAVVVNIFSFLTETELLMKASVVSTSWADGAATAHANLMLASLGSTDVPEEDADSESEDDQGSVASADIEEDAGSTSAPAGISSLRNTVAASMERRWSSLTRSFPTGQFLSEGGFKVVYKVWNAAVGQEEAVSVMDMDRVDPNVVAAELSISCLLSSLTRRAICPNFVLTRGIFNCPYEPPACRWGCPEKKKPRIPKQPKTPREPDEAYPGRYHYIRMELCNLGDAEEYMKSLSDKMMSTQLAQCILFQCSFALHAAAERFSMKHYDMKLLNIFLQQQEVAPGDVVMRYGLGSHVFALRMPGKQALVAKVADLGTASIKPEFNGQPVTIAQFTTLENTPIDFMILGDAATQGHGHDCWGLGLCMLHLFTGHKPYEEILETVECPPNLKKRLRMIWENEAIDGYETIRSVILSDVSKDEAGNIIDGEPDETFYHTLYRYLVLFGIPQEKFGWKKYPLVWDAITECLEGATVSGKGRRGNRRSKGLDEGQFRRDQRKFSLQSGNDRHIARARKRLKSMKGGTDLLLKLCAFDPSQRASAMDVLNHQFMANLREVPGQSYRAPDRVYSYTAFATHAAS